MRTPRHPPDRIIVARKYNQRSLFGRPDIKCPDQPVHARRRHDRRAVFIPVVREGFVGRKCSCWAGCLRRRELGWGLGGVDGDCEDEVVGGGGGGTEVEEAEMGVAGDGGEEGGRVRGEGGGVGAGVDGEGEEGGWARWIPLWLYYVRAVGSGEGRW